MDEFLQPLCLEAEYQGYVWGGSRLRPGISPTAEAWVVYENDHILNGPLAGKTLAEAAKLKGEALLGRRVVRQNGMEFPLLIKLLDCAQWLSLQVHPNDEQAKKLEGPEMRGKTEAWHILNAEADAELLAGLKPGVSRAALGRALQDGSILDLVQRLPVNNGDSVFMPAGMVHALGPGLLVYEVQQTSNITYRVFDWNRPATPERPLHIEKSLEVINLDLKGEVIPPPPLADGERHPLIACPYFQLESLNSSGVPIALDTRSESFHALTLIEGSALIEGAGWKTALAQWQSAVIPAACDAYQITPQGSFKALLAWVK